MARIQIARGNSGIFDGKYDRENGGMSGELFFNTDSDKLYIRKEGTDKVLRTIMINPTIPTSIQSSLNYQGHTELVNPVRGPTKGDNKIGDFYIVGDNNVVVNNNDPVESDGGPEDDVYTKGAWFIVETLDVDGNPASYIRVHHYELATDLPRGTVGTLPTFANYDTDAAATDVLHEGTPISAHVARVEQFSNSLAEHKLEYVDIASIEGLKKGQFTLAVTDKYLGQACNKGDLIVRRYDNSIKVVSLSNVDASTTTYSGFADNTAGSLPVGIIETGDKATTVAAALTSLNMNKADLEGGKVRLDQMPATIVGGMQYRGTLQANANGTGLNALIEEAIKDSDIGELSNGDYFIVVSSVADTPASNPNESDTSKEFLWLGAGDPGEYYDAMAARPGDWIVYDESKTDPNIPELIHLGFSKIDNTDHLTGIKVGVDGSVVRGLPTLVTHSTDSEVTFTVESSGETITHTINPQALVARLDLDIGNLETANGKMVDKTDSIQDAIFEKTPAGDFDETTVNEIQNKLSNNVSKNPQTIVAALEEVRKAIGFGDGGDGSLQDQMDQKIIDAIPAGDTQVLLGTAIAGKSTPAVGMTYTSKLDGKEQELTITTIDNTAITSDGNSTVLIAAKEDAPTVTLEDTNNATVDRITTTTILSQTGIVRTQKDNAEVELIPDGHVLIPAGEGGVPAAVTVPKTSEIDFDNRTIMGYAIDYSVDRDNSLVSRAVVNGLLEHILKDATIDGGTYFN